MAKTKEFDTPIDIKDRYKLIFDEHHYASDLRVKIFQGWCVIYAAIAAAFVWVQLNLKPLSWVVTGIAILVTVLMWVADIRHRSGLRASKDVGSEIERDPDASIPENQRFFARVVPETFLEKALTHSRAIDYFSIITIVALTLATVYLWCSKGVLPS